MQLHNLNATLLDGVDFVFAAALAGYEAVYLAEVSAMEVVLAPDFAVGCQHIAFALTAAQHGFVDGGFGQYRGSDAAIGADAAYADKGFVGDYLGQGMEGEFADQ